MANNTNNKTNMVGNIGEWSEPYVALRLLGDGKLFLADDNNKKNPNEWMKILELIRKEAKERIVTYKYDEKETDIIIDVNGKIIINLPVGDFMKMADTLYQEVNNAKKKKSQKKEDQKKGSFSISDNVTDFLKRAEYTTNKAKSNDKNDIFLSVADPRTSIVRKSIGFSIKSKLGKDPTLFNTAKASGVKYELHNMSDEIMEEINKILDSKGKVSVIERCRFIKEKQLNPTYCGYVIPKRAKCETFKENLEVLNPRLPDVIERILWYHFFEEYKKTDIKDIVNLLKDKNPCEIKRQQEIKYQYMIKSFLYASYCGLTASTLWDGRSQVNGGFIFVDKSGNVLAKYALESESFKNYLYNNCYFEFPGTDKDHGDYGKVYKDATNRYFFNLNFQIRYR